MIEELKNNFEETKNNIGNFIRNGLDNIVEAQNKFLKSNLGQAINGGINFGLKAVLPNCVEDEIIKIKDSLITEGFSAAMDVAIEEASNLGKSIIGIFTGSFENISQIKNAIEKGGLIDTISELLDTGIDWAKKQGYIKSSVATTIKKGKNTMLKEIKNNVDNSLSEQIEVLNKIDGYVKKWKKYYKEENFTNMEYQYKKIEEYLEKIVPLEDILKEARTIENLHELIKNKGKNFNITNEEKELAEMLAF